MSSDDREQGIDFGDLNEKLNQHEYPVAADDLIDEYGNYKIEHSNGTETFRDVLGPLAEQEDHQFDSADDVRQMVLNMIDSEAVGRQGYSDRGSEHVQDEQESL